MTGGHGCDTTLPGSQPPPLPRRGSGGPGGRPVPWPEPRQVPTATACPLDAHSPGWVRRGVSATQTESRGAGWAPRCPRQSQACSEDRPASGSPQHKAGPLLRPQHGLWRPHVWWGSPCETRRPLMTYSPAWLPTTDISYLKPPQGGTWVTRGAQLVTAARPAS